MDAMKRMKEREDIYKDMFKMFCSQLMNDNIGVQRFIKNYVDNITFDGDHSKDHQHLQYVKGLSEKKLKHYANLTLLTRLISLDDLNPLEIYDIVLKS